jgi:DNA polymerase-3 subunit beta
VRQAAIVTSEERRGVDFTFTEGKLALAAHGAEMGESHVEMPVAYEGAEIQVKLDPRFMSDFLRILDPDQTFTLQVRDEKSAVVCQTDDGYAYVIMPLSRGG